MPFSEFQPGNAGLALPQFQFQSGIQTMEAGMSMMDRAQRLKMDQQRLENEKQQLASNLALNAKRVEEMGAQITNLNLQAEGYRVDNQIKTATSKFTIGAMDQASKLFGQGSDSPNSSSQFQNDVAPLYTMELNTPQQIANFKAQLALVNGKYSALAHVHPAAKMMFDQALAPLAAKAEGASTLLSARAMTEAKALETDLLAVTDSASLNKFISENRDRHSVALLDPKYAEVYATTAKDVRDKAATLANSKALQQGSLDNERAMLTQKSTVDYPEIGIKGVAPTPEAAQKVRDTAAIYVPTKDALDKLDGIAAEVIKDPKKKLSPETTADAQTYQQQLISAIGRMQVGGVLSDSEAQTMKRLVPDPTKLLKFDSATVASLKALRHELEVRMDAFSMANGIRRTKPAEGGANTAVTTDPGSYAAAVAEAKKRGLKSP